MAFDGFVVSALTNEFNRLLTGGRITKISQPEKDEIILTIKNYDTYRLFISVNASLPLIRISDENKAAPLTAPGFCMLLRKHLNSARILSIKSPDMERAVFIEIEHLNEMGDVCRKYLIAELMGRHSNIIFTDEDYNIIDSIKHISAMVSSVREVLPGRKYFIPKTTDKVDASVLDKQQIAEIISGANKDVCGGICSSFTGFSSLMSTEICYCAKVPADKNTAALSSDELDRLSDTVLGFTERIKNAAFSPNIIFEGDEAFEFSCFDITYLAVAGYTSEKYERMSDVISAYYSLKEKNTRIKQKSVTLRKTVSTLTERAAKKYDLQLKQLESTKKRDKYRVYGELITAYGYGAEEGSDKLVCTNYYDGEEITIPLDPTIPVMENAKHYFDRYAKLKRTYTAVTEQLAETKSELEHLNSISNALTISENESDLNEIRQELEACGYMKKTSSNGKKRDNKKASHTGFLHYLTPEGFHIYVGKNNLQNDELTFKFAENSDWWFHAKQIAGSHVILKTEGREIPDRVFERAASAAAYYSYDKSGGKVEVDYVLKKEVKKPNGAKAGFVVYYTNYSMTVTPDIKDLELIN